MTNGGTPFIVPGFQRSLNSSTVATVSFTRPSGKKFLRKNAKLTRNPFLLPSIVRNEENSGYQSVLGCWVVGWGYWLSIEYVSLVCLSNIRAAGTMSHKLYGFRKILELCCSSTEQVWWSLLGMHWRFSGSRNAFPFSVELSGFCRSFSEEHSTTFKIYISHHVLLVNDVYTSSNETIFLTLGPDFDVRSSSGSETEQIASFVGS